MDVNTVRSSCAGLNTSTGDCGGAMFSSMVGSCVRVPFSAMSTGERSTSALSTCVTSCPTNQSLSATSTRATLPATTVERSNSGMKIWSPSSAKKLMAWAARPSSSVISLTTGVRSPRA